MGTVAKLEKAWKRKSTTYRNYLRSLIARITTVTKDDGSGLEDSIVTNSALADGSVTEIKVGAAAVSMSKCKFPVTGANLLPKNYSSFAALEHSAPSTDLYVVSGGFSSLGYNTTERVHGSGSMIMVVSAGGGTLALATGASNYPQAALSGLLGTHHILSLYYKRSALSGHTFVIQLRFSDSSTQTISGTLTPTTSWQRYISSPFTLNSTSLAYRVEFVVTSASGSRTTYIADAMLVCTGSDANVTEVGPFVAGVNWQADNVDVTTLRLNSSGTVTNFAGTAAGVIRDSGSGLIHNAGAAYDLKVQAGKKITVGTQDVIDASGNLAIASGKTITVGSQAIVDASANIALASGKTVAVGSQTIIDSSANLALASGKTIAVGSATIVNSSGVIQSRRTLFASPAENLSGGATVKEATTANTSYTTINDGAIYLHASERVELNLQLWSGAGAGEYSSAQLECNGVTASVNATGGASAWQSKTVNLNPGSSGLLLFKIYIKSSVGTFTAKARYWVIDGYF